MKNYKQLVEAIQQATSPDELRAILFDWFGKKREAISAIAEFARAWDDALVQLILVAEAGGSKLLNNPYRPANAEYLVARWHAQCLQSEAVHDKLEFAVTILSKLVARGALPLSGEICQSLLASLKPRSRHRGLTHRQVLVAGFLLEHPETDAATLEKMLDLMGESLPPDLAPNFVLHDAATSEIRKRVLVSQLPVHSWIGRIDNIVKRDDLRNDSELRLRLVEIVLGELDRRHDFPFAARILIEDGNSADCVILIGSRNPNGRDHGVRFCAPRERAASDLFAFTFTCTMRPRFGTSPAQNLSFFFFRRSRRRACISSGARAAVPIPEQTD